MWCAAPVGASVSEGRRSWTAFRLAGVRGWLVAGLRSLSARLGRVRFGLGLLVVGGAVEGGTLPWSQRREVARRAAAADVMLDMGTRGGERLSRLHPRPAADDRYRSDGEAPGRGRAQLRRR